MAPWNPTPVIAVSEYPLCEPVTDALGRTVFDGSRRTLVGSASIEWGRDDPWTQPEPATLTFTMFDPSRYWINRITGRTAVGTGVLMTVPLPAGTNRPDMPNDEFTLFQGFVSNVKVTEHRALTTKGKITGHLVEITAGDRTSMLGNVMFSWEDWPAERMVDRAIRIRNRLAGIGIREYYYEAPFKDAAVRPIEVRDKTALTMLRDLYQSFAHQWTYSQNRNVVIRIPEHRFTETPTFAIARGSNDVILTMPNMSDWTGEESPIDKAPHAGTGVDGAVTEGALELDSDRISVINLVEMTWQNRHDAYRTIVSSTVVEGSVPPYRTLAFESWLSDGVQADPVRANAGSKAFWGQSGPHHPAIKLDTRRTGGFASVGQGIALLSATEARGYVYVNGSPWSEVIGRLPVGAPSGGRITYERGHWQTETKLLATETTAGRGDLTYHDLDQRIAWGHPRPAGMFQFGGVHWWDLAQPHTPTIYYLT